MPGRDSRGHGDARDDADRGGVASAQACAAVSTGNLGDQSGEYGPFHRIDGPGTSQTLPGPAGNRALVESETGIDSGVEGWLRAHVDSDAEGGSFADQQGCHDVAHCKASAGESRARS